MQLVRSWENSSSSIHRVRPANSHWRGVRGGAAAAGWRLAKLQDSEGGGGEGEREMVRDGSGRFLAIVALLDRPGATAAAVLVVEVVLVDSLSSSK